MRNKKGCILSFLLVLFIFGVTIPLFMTNHKKIKADTISDLTNTIWLLNDEISWINNDGFSSGISITFTSNNNNYNNLVFENVDEDFDDYYLGYQNTSPYRYDTCYYASGRYGYTNLNITDTDYQQITITGGSDVTDSTFITWLQNNATQQNPTPTGTRILYKYWSPYGIIQMTDNQVVGDNDIQYKVLFNEFTSSYDETTQTGLIFKGVLTNQEPAWSYIESINGSGINILYHGETNRLNNSMWLEFTYGDYMDSDLYNFMDLQGHWFDDGDAYIVGMNQGYVEGTAHGRALGQADGTQYEGLITGIFNGLGGLLSIQVFPNITIALLIGLPLLLGVFIIIIKILRG